MPIRNEPSDMRDDDRPDVFAAAADESSVEIGVPVPPDDRANPGRIGDPRILEGPI